MDAQSFADSVLLRVSQAVEADDDANLHQELASLVKQFTGSSKAAATPNTATVLKTNDDQQIAWGWALVSVEKGEPVHDLQGDVVDTDELQHAVHTSFMDGGRVGKMMHSGGPVGEVVDSIVFTKDLQDALGIDLGREGWFVGMKIHKKSVWDLVKSGALPAFSIGGEGERHPMIAKRGRSAPAMFLDVLRKAWSPEAREAALEARKAQAKGATKEAEKASMHANQANTYEAHLDAAKKIRAAGALHEENGNKSQVTRHNSAAKYHEGKANELAYAATGPKSLAGIKLSPHAAAVHAHLAANGGTAEHGDIHQALDAHHTAAKVSAGLKELKAKGLATGGKMTGHGDTYHTTSLRAAGHVGKRGGAPAMFRDVLAKAKDARGHGSNGGDSGKNTRYNAQGQPIGWHGHPLVGSGPPKGYSPSRWLMGQSAKAKAGSKMAREAGTQHGHLDMAKTHTALAARFRADGFHTMGAAHEKMAAFHNKQAALSVKKDYTEEQLTALAERVEALHGAPTTDPELLKRLDRLIALPQAAPVPQQVPNNTINVTVAPPAPGVSKQVTFQRDATGRPVGASVSDPEPTT